MPSWAGKWKGGRYYLDAEGQPVFFIERRRKSVRLATHDEELAKGQLATFLEDPDKFTAKPAPAAVVEPVYLTSERINLYLASIADSVADHRTARKKYLQAWSELKLDLRTADRRALRTALADFGGGHRGRTEALNAFARFLVKEGDLPAWNPLVNTRAPKATRADREAYSLEQLREGYARLTTQPLRDVFHLRAALGLHYTEIEQLEGCRVYDGPLPDKGVGVRALGGWWDHEIQGVIQVVHKSRRKHRASVDAAGLRAALRLRDGVPDRVTVWEAFSPLVPSNLRHTFTTLAGEVGSLVTYVGGGVDRARIAQALGHRAGSTMTADRYDKLQVPPMIRLPLGWDVA